MEPIDDAATPPQSTQDRVRLTDWQIDHIVEALKAGKTLPPHLFPHLFETPREYELAYRGKTRRADVLSETMAAPLQPVKTYGTSHDGWSNALIFGDNLQVLKTLLQAKIDGHLRNADGTDGVRLCYIDPPFASMREFKSGQGQIAYSDRVAGAEFVEHLRKRLIFIHELLADNGTLYVHMDWKKGHYIKVILDELFGPHNFRNEIVWWYYNKYQGNINRFPSDHDVIYAYGKSDTVIFNAQYEEREEATRQLRRVWDKERQKLVNAKDDQGRVIYVEKTDRRVDDVWRLPMIQPADRTQRVDFPTQKPEALLSVIVAASSNEGDIVLDAFMGSGTTAIVADRMRRRWIGIDSGKFAIYTTQKRLLKRGPVSQEPAFSLYNAGLYDYQALRDLPWSGYRQFVLKLFQCERRRHQLAGVEFDGYLGDHPVLVYNFTEHPEAKIGLDFVQDLAAVIGERLGPKCFLIAPAVTVEPYEDYVDIGHTRFYFLRIPYSIIEELHRQAFTHLSQPTSSEMINATIESVGFDFVVPPLVETSTFTRGNTAYIQIEKFESGTLTALGQGSDMYSLAMVLLDLAYDGDVFAVDDVYFAEQLRGTDWRISFPEGELGDQIMIVYIDVAGNEYRSLVDKATFSHAES